jgi:hypothetical protein
MDLGCWLRRRLLRAPLAASVRLEQRPIVTLKERTHE